MSTEATAPAEPPAPAATPPDESAIAAPPAQEQNFSAEFLSAEARADSLRAAAKEAREATERLKEAAKEAKEAEPSVWGTALNGLIWGGATVLALWGLGALLDWASEAKAKSQRRPRGTEDADTEPTYPTTPSPASAQ